MVFTARIHPTAVIDEGAEIGESTSIWHFCHVMSGVRVGKRCNIGQNVYVDRNVVIGDRCKIQNNVSVYNGVSIGDDVFVGPNVAFTNDLVPRAFNTEWRITETKVETGASLGANSTIVCATGCCKSTSTICLCTMRRPL